MPPSSVTAVWRGVHTVKAAALSESWRGSRAPSGPRLEGTRQSPCTMWDASGGCRVQKGRAQLPQRNPTPPDAKKWLIWKDPDAGQDWGQEQKGMTEDEMVGWHDQLDGHGFRWTPGVGDGHGGLVCCSSWVAKNQTWLSNWTELTEIVRDIILVVAQLILLAE